MHARRVAWPAYPWGWGHPLLTRHPRGRDREHAIVDRLLSVVSLFESEWSSGQSESDRPFVRSEFVSDRPAIEQVSPIVNRSVIHHEADRRSAIHHEADRQFIMRPIDASNGF